MDDLTFGEKLKRLINSDDADELLRLCCDSSKRKEILEFTDDDGHCLLHLVAGSGTVDLFRTFIDLGAELNEESCNLQSILQTACSHGNTEIVKYLLTSDGDYKNNTTKTECNRFINLFYYAAQSGNIETIKCLQDIGHLDINEIYLNGSSILLVLVAEKYCRGVETLCQCGADVNIGTINNGLKAIHLASEDSKNGSEMIQILLKYGADVNEPFVRSKLNQHPLFMALKVGNLENAKVLLEYGADISFQGATFKDTIGCFCLAIKNCPLLVPEFIKRGANLNETHRNCSVLMIALDSNAGSEAIEALVKAGANIEFGRDGKTVLQCCTHYDQLNPFRNAGISVQDIESKHKVSTLVMALNSKVMSSSYCCHFGRSCFTFDNALSKFETENEITKRVENETRDLISNGANPDMYTKEHDIPLVTAIQNKLQGVFELLQAAGANIHQLGKDGNSAVHVCCIESNWKFLEKLMESDIDLNRANTKGDFPLELAIKGKTDLYSNQFQMSLLYNETCDDETNPSKDIIKKMLDKGANPNLTANGKNSPLILAIMKGLDSIVDVLLDDGADICHIGEKKLTTIESALKTNHKNIIKALIEKGISLVEPTSTGKYPLEMLKMQCENCSLFILMLANGANPNNITAGDNSVLTTAVRIGLHEITMALLNAGADVNHKDEDGNTAFDIFAKRNIINDDLGQTEVEFFKKCIFAGLDMNQHNLSGSFPLLMAVSNGGDDIVKLILDTGVDVNFFNQSGETPLTEAISRGFDDIVRLLLEYGANVNLICKRSTIVHPENGQVYTDFNSSISESEDEDEIFENTSYQFEMSTLSKVITNYPYAWSLEKRKHFVDLLLELGADPNLETSGVDSSLMHAVRFGDPVLVKTLLVANVDPCHTGNNGCTVLHVFFLTYRSTASSWLYQDPTYTGSFEENRAAILKMLLEYGSPINVSSSDENLPIHIALAFCKTSFEFEQHQDVIITMIDLTKDLNLLGKNSSTPFLTVIKFCSKDVLEKMVEQGADVNSKGLNGNTALHVVMEKEDFNNDFVSFLLIHGADINAVNNFEETPLVTFIKRGSSFATVEHLLFLLENGAEPNVSPEGCNSALQEAIAFPAFDVVSVLIEAKANLNHVGKNGNTVLHTVFSKVCKEHMDQDPYQCRVLETTIKLVDAGACINILNKDGHTPLYYLIEKQDISTINQVLPYLLTKEADPSIGADLPLITAANLNQTTTLNMLLEHGIDVDKKNSRGNTALTTILDTYSGGCRKETVDILLNAAASVHLTDGDGKTPLVLLINSIGQYISYTISDKQAMQIVSELIEKGADPNSTPFGEDSALILAVEYVLPTVVQILLESGADINHVGQNGQNVLHSCFRRKETRYFGNDYPEDKLPKILEALLAKKSDVNLKDNDGLSPLQLAIQNREVEEVEIFLSTNPDILHHENDKLNTFEICLASKCTPAVALQILGALIGHLNLHKNADAFFHKFWDYIKTVNFSEDNESLDNVTFKILYSVEKVHVNLENHLNDSPLIYFCQNECPQAVIMLLFHGADVNHVGKNGTALHYIIDLTDDECAELLFDCLLKEHPCLQISDNKGKTVIQKAIDILCGKRGENLRMGYQYRSSVNEDKFKTVSSHVKKLLDAGLTLDLNDLNDALLVCAKQSDFKGMECFLFHGGDCFQKDENGISILHLCWSKSLDGGLEFLQFFVDTQHCLNRFDSDENSLLLSVLTCEATYMHESQEIDRHISDITSFLIKNGACCVKDKEGNWPLHIAAKNGYLATVDVLLQLDIGSINDKNKAGDTALHLCLKHPKENVCEVVKRLIESKNSKLWMKLHDDSMLYLATVAAQEMNSNNLDLHSITSQLVEILLANGADPNNYSDDDIPLLSALEHRDLHTSTLLLEASANINATNCKGKSGLHIILENYTKDNDLCLTKLLVEKGINVNLVDKDGKSSMIYLVEKYDGYDNESLVDSFEDIFKVLVKHGADLNLYNTLDETVLCYFCSSGSKFEIGNILLKNGADPKIGYCLQNLLGNNQFFKNETSLLSFLPPLLEKGADPNRRNIKGSNLIDSVERRNIFFVEELIKYGANINYCDNMKKTALHYACNLGDLKDRYEISAFLVKHGSNLNAASDSGERPLDIVVSNMIKEMSFAFHKATEDSFSKLAIDLSLLNLLVCGGADLCPLIPDTDEKYCGNSSFPTIPTNISNTDESPLFSLVSNGLFQTAEYLLRSGWDVEKEEWFDTFDVTELALGNITNNRIIYKRHDIETKKAEFNSFLQNFEKGPKSLSTLCRNRIRKQLLLVSNGSEIETKIPMLPLPVKIKRYLSLKECIQENDIILLEMDEGTESNTAYDVQVLQAIRLFSMLESLYDSDDYS